MYVFKQYNVSIREFACMTLHGNLCIALHVIGKVRFTQYSSELHVAQLHMPSAYCALPTFSSFPPVCMGTRMRTCSSYVFPLIPPCIHTYTYTQPIISIFRCKPGAKYRRVFDWVHGKIIGRLVIVFACKRA